MRAVSMLTVQGRDGGQTEKLAGEDAVASEYCCRTEIRSATREPKLAVRAYAHRNGMLCAGTEYVRPPNCGCILGECWLCCRLLSR